MSTGDATIPTGSVEGALYVGNSVSLILFGWFLTQAWNYYRTCHYDHALIKGFVALIVLLESCATVLATTGIYNDVITNFGQPSKIFGIQICYIVLFFALPITTCLVQTFFLYRLHRLSGNSPIDYIILVLSSVADFSSCAVGLVIAAALLRFQVITHIYDQHYKFMAAAQSGLAALCDVLITWSLCRRLAGWKNGLASTERTIMNISSFMLSRGILLMLLQIAGFIAYLAPTQTNAFLFFPVVMAKLYANSLLSFLVTFEPLKLKMRVPLTGFPSATRLVEGPRNIRLDVVQTTDGVVSDEVGSTHSISEGGKMNVQCILGGDDFQYLA